MARDSSDAVDRLTGRIEHLEADRRRAKSVPPTRNFADTGHKQIAFKKIPGSASAADRLRDIEAFMATNFPGIRVKDCYNIRTGPFPKDRTAERKLAHVSIVELSTSDIQREVLQKIKVGGLTCKIGGTVVEIKAGRTEIASQRDNCLRKAADLLREDSRVKGQEVKIQFRENRGVTVGASYAYEQPKGTAMGEFVPAFRDLSLP